MANYERRRYLVIATDPVHIGTGGYRLGRVDNSIVRDPGTKLPKIPGSSLHGAIRSYAARLYEDLEAAGQDHSAVLDVKADPICYTFGYIRKGNGGDEEAKGEAGVVSIFDAHILLFPVHSMVGPLWVTTESLLRAVGVGVTNGAPASATQVKLTFSHSGSLNAGWLMLQADGGGMAALTPPGEWANADEWKAVEKRIALVDDSLFSQIVNSNLEVRTSVSIDPVTGAAKESALFTYETLPRATFLTFEVVLDDYQAAAGETQPAFVKAANGQTAKAGRTLPGKAWNGPLDVVDAGIDLLAWLGVGGMGTRGFGRLKKVAETHQAYAAQGGE